MKFIVAGHEYPMVENPTLGELRILKRDFDLREVDALNPKDVDHMAGMLYIAMRRVDPNVDVDVIDSLTTIEVVNDDGTPVDPEQGPDPQPAAADPAE